jgi:hypothetical protein
MRYESLKKHANQRIRIRPALQRYSDVGKLETTIDDTWWFDEVSEDGARFKNEATTHTIRIGLDSIHNFMSDAEQRDGAKGTLVLTAQLLLYRGQLIAEPTSPGAPLKHFAAPVTRQTLQEVAQRQHAARELDERRAEFDREGVAEALNAFKEIGDVLRAIQADPANAVMELFVHQHNSGYLISACRWWVTINWNMRFSLKESYLSIIKWSGRPNVPGNLSYSFDSAETRSETKYRYGLARMGEAGWIKAGQPDIPIGTREIIETTLIDLCQTPNNEPAPVWRLDRNS